MKAVIVDDEPDAIEVLVDLLKDYCPEVLVIGTANSVKNALASMEEIDPDILFLDIQMPGESGFDLLQKTENQRFQTIFVSAHMNHAIEAVKFHAMAYLLKPVDPLKLIEAVHLAKVQMEEKTKSDYTPLLNNLNQSSSRKIAIPTGKGYRYFDPINIIRIEAAKNYSYVVIIEQTQPILVSRNLKQFEALMAGHNFLRVHNAHLVNPQHISEYFRKDGGGLIMSDEQEILIGPKYRDLVLHYLDKISDRFR